MWRIQAASAARVSSPCYLVPVKGAREVADTLVEQDLALLVLVQNVDATGAQVLYPHPDR